MNRLTIISPAFYPAPSSLLIDSCNNLDLNLRLYGMGEPFTTLFDTKVNQLIPEIEKLDSEYILLTDFCDSFILANEDEIISKFLKFDTSLLVSADRQHEELDSRYPYSIFRDNYPPSDTPWRYCNSGGYIGKKQTILNLLDKMRTLSWSACQKFVPIYRQSDWDNDQFRMSLAYLLGFNLTVDTYCEVFQTMGCIQPRELEWFYDSRYLNRVTGTKPCVVHFNGNSPGIEKFFQSRFAKVTYAESSR